jgi:hypothetical protein
MAHIVCQATAFPGSDQLEFLWSEGPASFEPYHLRDVPLISFDRAVADARKALFKVVLLSRDDKAELLPDACLALARAGHELYTALFPPKVGQMQDPEEVRAWLEGLRADRQVDSLEVLLTEKVETGPTLQPSAPRAVERPLRRAPQSRPVRGPERPRPGVAAVLGRPLQPGRGPQGRSPPAHAVLGQEVARGLRGGP